MSLKLGSALIAGTNLDTKSNAHSLFDVKWSDHILNEMSWLRSDTFSWQSGSVYVAAYNHLVADNSSGTSKTETINGYTISYVEAPDGHKITTDETNVANIYNSTGVAWYYVLDTTNQRFKLPRTKFGFEGLRDSAGKYISPGLPNITSGSAKVMGWYNNAATWQQGSLKKTDTNNASMTSGGAWTNSGVTELKASYENSIYGNSNTVQPPATQMYLYFYVGDFSQSATEQTAGLNAELFNEKADISNTVTLNTNQTITGVKAYTSTVFHQNLADDASATPSSNLALYPLVTKDKNGYDMSYISTSHNTNGYSTITLNASVGTSTDRKQAYFQVAVNPSGAAGAYATGSVKASIANWAMPNYSGAVAIASGYVTTSNGVFMGVCESASNYSLTIGGINIINHSYSNTQVAFPFAIPVPKGVTITFASLSNTKFLPCLGV